MKTAEESTVCEICYKNPPVGVTSSSLGPFSFAYCKECSKQEAEPAWIIFGMLDACGGAESWIADWVKEIKTFRYGRYIDWDDIIRFYKQELKEIEQWASLSIG